MPQTEQAGEDASLDAVAERIMAIGSEKYSQDVTKLDREPKDLDLHETQETGELDEAVTDEEAVQEAKADADEKADEAAFIELPPAEDGGEAEQIPLPEAVEAIKAYRQLQGDIATAVVRAETEAQTKQDAITDATMKAFDTVRVQAMTALKAMQAYMPQQPDPILLDRSSQYYDPEGFHLAKLRYDDHMAFMGQVQATIGQAQEGLKQTETFRNQEWDRREAERIARYIPEWKDDKAREAKRTDILDVLGKKYGLTKEEMDDIVDHKAWRMMNDLANLTKAQTKAPEVRKAVQEKAAKLVNGRPSQTRSPDGKFISDARKALKETGSEDAFANYLLRAGATRKR